ncbi:uncharacterized protein CC84DRAFT_1159192 [Paraphaeosphaeria sporulosa]|uniref:Secreted protein n=1 Tax=Paraphaeosphaeria sporulosa TaxID=1460663 RepID=A0A177CXW1_9PLEO|nr:uncharacterized protein CC84DRAFT_1159192 [Paraphaeosphaeria sporulosa]OAG11732.1 hypothetical protein CC84DRAFT_1159192 [Paraphaeosphaeria sporulosa]
MFSSSASLYLAIFACVLSMSAVALRFCPRFTPLEAPALCASSSACLSSDEAFFLRPRFALPFAS